MNTCFKCYRVLLGFIIDFCFVFGPATTRRRRWRPLRVFLLSRSLSLSFFLSFSRVIHFGFLSIFHVFSRRPGEGHRANSDAHTTRPSFTRFSLRFIRFSFVLPSFTEFYLFSRKCTGFYLVLLCFTEFYRVLTSFNEFYRVIPIFP